jgi:transposase-like protein
MVGILRNYCNRNLATRQVNELVDEARASHRSTTVRSTRTRAIRHLSPDQREDLINFYQAGDSLYELSRRFSIHRETVKLHMTKASVPIRPGTQAKLSASDKDEIARLYESGLSIHKLALQFGVTDNPVHNALKERGVRMRDPHGRVR